MSRFTIFFVLFSASTLWLASRAPAQDFEDVVIEAVPVAGNVHMLTGAGGNIGVSVGPDGILMIDDQFAPLAEKIRAVLQDLGGGDLKFLLNTHWHGDHVGGNPVFGPEAPIISHTNVRRRLVADQVLERGTTPALPPEGWPVVTFDHSLSVHFNGEEIRAIHFPHSHTDGDAVVHFTGSNVVHMGDLLFSGVFPFVDIESGGTVEGLIASVEGILEELPEDVKLIPGHGPLSTKDDLRTYLRMLRETSAFVAGRKAAGESLEAIQEAGLPEEWKDWTWNFIPEARWIETLYRSAE